MKSKTFKMVLCVVLCIAVLLITLPALSGNAATYVSGNGITLSCSRVTTYVGCQYAFGQSGASGPQWSSSDTSIATISQNGVLTAIKAGTLTVTVSEGDKYATCPVTVLSGKSTGISKSSVILQNGKSIALTAMTSGVNWFSSNKRVATVSNGVITGVGFGYATISAYNADGASTCLVYVTEPQETDAIRLSANRAYTYVGCRYAIGVSGVINPNWSSSDTSVLTVDQNGVVTAKKAGCATVYASKNGGTASCRFTISNGNTTGISATDMQLITGTTGRLTASTAGVKWYSSNPAVATVSNGIVTAKSAGYTTISAYISGGASTCLIHVTSAAQTSDIKLCTYQATTYAGCQYAFWATGVSNIAWVTTDPSVATVDASGVLTTRTAGNTTLVASSDGKISTCKVIVKSGAATGISKRDMTVEKGKIATLTATASNVNWFSSNKNVATVSGGVVTAKGVGLTTISAYNSNGASTCLVKVTEPSATPTTPTTPTTPSVPTTPTQPDVPAVSSMGVVTAGNLNLRSGASTNYSIITTVTQGTKFTFVNNIVYDGSWHYIELANGTKGYVHGDYIEHLTVPEITLSVSRAYTYVGCQYAFSQTGAEAPEWKTTDSSVATIDKDGVMTAKNPGIVTVYATENGGMGSCTVTVKSGTSTGISPTTLNLTVGQVSQLTAKENGCGWFSSNKNVATVSGGTVTAKGVGLTTISAYTSGGASTCLVRVTKGSGSGTDTIKFNVKTATTYTGCQYAVPATGISGASWTSSNTGVATVDNRGVITAKSAGSAVIKASNASSTASLTLTVCSGSAPGISLSKDTIAAGKSLLLGSDSYYVNWFSSNTSVATVSNGVVTAKSAGVCTISAYTSYGASTCTLTVTEPDNIRFVYANPNSAPKNSSVTFKAITDNKRSAVRFIVSNGSTAYTVDATSKTTDGSNYIWSGSSTLSTPGLWTVKAYSKTSATDYATTPENGEGEVFVTNSTNKTTTVLGERRASNEVIELIAGFEGFLSTLTGDYITGDPTIGHGKVIWENEQFYNNLTRSEAYAYLCQTINDGPYTSVTNNFLTTNNARFNQQQFDALVSFAYNLGAYALTGDTILKNALLNGSKSGTVKAGGSGYINTSDVNLRAGAGTGYSILQSMAYNTAFTYVDATRYNSDWYKIKLSNGTVGYVYSDYASPIGSGADLANADKATLTQRMLQFHHASGSCYIGLLWRRVDEVEMFLYGDYVDDGDRNKYGMFYRCPNNPSFGIG